jgi:hypothetical protein
MYLIAIVVAGYVHSSLTSRYPYYPYSARGRKKYIFREESVRKSRAHNNSDACCGFVSIITRSYDDSYRKENVNIYTSETFDNFLRYNI